MTVQDLLDALLVLPRDLPVRRHDCENGACKISSVTIKYGVDRKSNSDADWSRRYMWPQETREEAVNLMDGEEGDTLLTFCEIR